ncbi:MAG: hypothetical protein Q8N23_09900 [Archangium sp.]|nr:hypothetical protein [Archangium sp.]MDP3152971.1 hypothetical protein [Archangium sp.]
MFPPFAAQVQAILGAKPDESRPLSEVERAMVAKLDGKGLPVLADWLISKGDPWGELITLRLSGEDDLAVEHFDTHLESLVGDMPGEDLSWLQGVVSRADLDGSGPGLRKKLEAVLTHRTASRLDTLDIYSTALEPALVTLLSEKAPASLTSLTLRGRAAGLEHLSLPRLEALRLELNPEAMAGLLKATLPKLRALTLQTTKKPLPVAFVEGLITSRLFARLEHLEFEEAGPVGSSLDDAGLRVLLGADTSRLKSTYVELAGRNVTPEQKKAAQKKFAKTNAVFLKNPPEEPEFDEL